MNSEMLSANLFDKIIGNLPRWAKSRSHVGGMANADVSFDCENEKH